MKDYKELFKCRLCGKVFTNTTLSTKDTFKIAYSEENQKCMHYCNIENDDNTKFNKIGIADGIGFEKIGF